MDGVRQRVASFAGLGVVLAAALAAAWVLLQDGLLRQVDWHVHLCWLQGFHDGMTQGVAYPRWIDGANQGQGGPVFLYYAPLAYWLGATAMRLGMHAATALETVYALSLLSCAAGLFAWLRRIAGPSRALLLAGVGLLTPQLTVFAYAYNMPASALAVGVMPWVGWALERRGTRTLRVVVLAVVLACLLLSHTLTGFQVMSLLASAGVVALATRRWRIDALRVLLPAALLATALAAAYVLPLLDQRDLIHAHHLTEAPNWRIAANFQFAWLFGGERAAFGEIAFDIANGAMLLMLAVAAWRLSRAPASDDGRTWLAYALAALVTFLMMTPLSAWLYAFVEPLRFLQFGWRWQAIFVLCVLRVVADALHRPATAPTTRAAFLPAAAMGACVVMAVACMAWITPPLASIVGGTPGVARVDDAGASRHAQRCLWPTLEYRPVAMGDGWRRDLDPLARVPTVLRGRGHVVSADVTNERKAYRIVADTPARVVFPVLQFPGWIVQRDGQDTAATALPHDGRIVVDLARGAHEIVLRFEPPLAARVGAVLSLCALALSLALVVLSTWRQRRTR